MSLVFAALTPHPPVLLPSIGKENTDKLKATADAFAALEKNLYTTNPETIVVLSPHGQLFDDAFSINVSPEYKVNFKEFGDIATTHTFASAMDDAFLIRRAIHNEHMPFTTYTSEEIDYGAALPLLFLTAHLPQIKIITIGPSLLTPKQHLDFGYLVKEAIMNTNKRIALIASADLSHRLTSDAPGGFSPAGRQFDDTVMESLKNRNTTALLNLKPDIVQEAASCGWHTLLMLLGALQRVNYELSVLAYESPFGVGYLTAEFSL